jgi:hypothetical protein
MIKIHPAHHTPSDCNVQDVFLIDTSPSESQIE